MEALSANGGRLSTHLGRLKSDFTNHTIKTLVLHRPFSLDHPVRSITCPFLESLTLQIDPTSSERTVFFPSLVCQRLTRSEVSRYHYFLTGLPAILSTLPLLESLKVEDEGVFEHVKLTHGALLSVHFSHNRGDALWMDMPRLTSTCLGTTTLARFQFRSPAPSLKVYCYRGHSS